MKRGIAAVALLLAVLAVVYGYTMTRRERLYRQHVVRGDYALARGDTFAAMSAFTDALALKPASMLGYLKRGEARYRRGELDAAAADLERASAQDATATRALELRGDVDLARRRPDSAAEHYAAYVRLDDRSPRVLYKLGLSRLLAGRTAAAAEALTTAVSLDTRLAEGHYLLGVCLRELQRPREAQRALERAVSLAPASVPAREQLADLYAVLGERERRIEVLEALFAADPRAHRQVALALAAAQAGQTPRAVRLLGHAAERYPDVAEIYLALGRIWLNIARTGQDRIAQGKAIAALHQAASMAPTSESLSLLGQARLSAADAGLAERTLREASEQRPADRASFLHLADAAERAGHIEAARRALLDYHSLTDPRDRRGGEIARRIAELSMRLGEPRAAAHWYARVENP